MVSSIKIPRKQHYVPRFYLAGFGRNGKMWVHDRERDVCESRNPKSVARKHHYYTVVTDQGNKDGTVEHVLELVESTAAEIIAKLDAEKMITAEDKIHLAQFVALLKFRVPLFERWFADFSEASIKRRMKDEFPTVESVQESMRKFGDKYDPTDAERAKGIFEGLQNPGYGVEFNDAARIAAMLIATLQISRVLTFLKWTFVLAPEGTSFVTTDNPVLVLGPSGKPPDPPQGWLGKLNPYSLAGEGFGTPGTQTVLPLSRRVYLVAEGEGTRMAFMRADRKWVRFANRTHAARRDNLLVARDEALIRSLIKV